MPFYKQELLDFIKWLKFLMIIMTLCSFSQRLSSHHSYISEELRYWDVNGVALFDKFQIRLKDAYLESLFRAKLKSLSFPSFFISSIFRYLVQPNFLLALLLS